MKIKIKKQLLFMTLIWSLVGCEIYDEGFDLSSQDVDKCEQAGGNCVEPTGANLLSLSVSTSNPTTVSSTTYCGVYNSSGSVVDSNAKCNFDVSGLCNEADFPENIIEFRVFDPGTNTNYITLKRAFNKCIRGKYRLRVSLPAVCVDTIKRLSIEILGRDLNGVENRNPLAALREVDLLFIHVPTPTSLVRPTCPSLPIE